MAGINVVLRSGPTGNDVYLRSDRSDVDVYLYAGSGTATDVYLRRSSLRLPDSGTAPPPFPTQYEFLRVWDNGAVQVISVVGTADAPAGMGGQVRVAKGGTVYAVYLVETTDPNASTVRIRTTSGVKAWRLKT